MKFGAMGDAHSELNEMDEAMSHYRKAANAAQNDYLAAYYLRKLAELQEYQGNAEGALETYQKIKSDYPNARGRQKYRTIHPSIGELSRCIGVRKCDNRSTCLTLNLTQITPGKTCLMPPG